MGWVLGPVRAPALIVSAASRAALVSLGLLLVAVFGDSEVLALVARASFLAVLGFFCGGFSQALAMAAAERGLRADGHGRPRAGPDACPLLLWILVLVATVGPLLAARGLP